MPRLDLTRPPLRPPPESPEWMPADSEGEITFNLTKTQTLVVGMCNDFLSIYNRYVQECMPIKLRGRAFAHGAMGRRIDPSWGGPIELFLVPASAPRLV